MDYLSHCCPFNKRHLQIQLQSALVHYFGKISWWLTKSRFHTKAIDTSLQVLPSLWSADFLQNWRQEIPQIIAQNSWKLCFHPYKMSWTKFGWKTLLDLWTLIILWHLETIWGFEFVIFVSKITKIQKHV